MKNQRWILAAHPVGALHEGIWELQEGELPTPAARQILVQTQWLSVDPYMRGRLNPNGGMRVGDLMQGGGVGTVIASNHPGWKVGDVAESLDLGWQTYSVLTPDLPGPARVNKVDTNIAPPHASLSWLGMPGLTAYFAMLEIGRPRPGDVVVVSAASGAVGQIAGQIAKLCGARTVGIAGSAEKIDWCRQIGFDDAINYKQVDLAATLANRVPTGVNVFFDATGGPIHDAVMKNLALNARVAVVGKVAVTDKSMDEDIGLRASSRLIATRATVQGFVVYDWWHRREEALARLADWHRSGAIQFKEDILHGIESVPSAFIRMMNGQNLGKQLIEI